MDAMGLAGCEIRASAPWHWDSRPLRSLELWTRNLSEVLRVGLRGVDPTDPNRVFPPLVVYGAALWPDLSLDLDVALGLNLALVALYGSDSDVYPSLAGLGELSDQPAAARGDRFVDPPDPWGDQTRLEYFAPLD